MKVVSKDTSIYMNEGRKREANKTHVNRDMVLLGDDTTTIGANKKNNMLAILMLWLIRAMNVWE